jgi:hypothetical protein
MISMGFPLTEKTLELNILKNMLEDIQKNFSPTAYLYGFSLRCESTTGLDASIRVPSNPLMLALQFKKAVKKTNPTTYVFNFNNNVYRNQHNIIYLSASRVYPPSVFYVLPAFVDINELLKSSPNFLTRTYLLNPLLIGPINNRRVHSIIANISSRTCIIRSEISKKEIKLYSWREILEAIQTKEVGTNVRTFVDRIKVPASLIRGKAFLREGKPARINLRSLMIQ